MLYRLRVVGVAALAVALGGCANLDPTPSATGTVTKPEVARVGKVERPFERAEAKPDAATPIFQASFASPSKGVLLTDHGTCRAEARTATNPPGDAKLAVDRKRLEFFDDRHGPDKTVYINCMKQKGWDLVEPGALSINDASLPEPDLRSIR